MSATPTLNAARNVRKKTLAKKKKTGFALWMDRVILECDRASVDFGADPVHDLRVALRRCRSLADGLMTIDPDPDWKAMKRAGKRIFQSLGELRDVQVMEEWVDRLAEPADPIHVTLGQYLENRQIQLKMEAATALSEFDRKQWKRWGTVLPRRAARLRPGSPVFKHLALERWTQAYELHRRALRNRSKVALHSLRIGIKRFRYIVENFLPEQHAAWKDDLKLLQDLLGEIHDLDVLWATALQINAFQDAESRSRWQARIALERAGRVEKYRAKMVGADSLWPIWRAALPQGKEVEASGLRRFKLWASFLDPDVRHTAHVARLALQLYDGLPIKARAERNLRDLRSILEVAAILHNVGSGKGNDKRRKPARLIQRLKPPLGWSAEDLRMVRAIVRYQRGGVYGARAKALMDLTPAQRSDAMRLAGILRIADAFDVGHDGRIRRLVVQHESGVLMVAAEGYSARDRIAAAIASARHLLEIVYRRPVMVKPLRIRKRVHKAVTLQAA